MFNHLLQPWSVQIVKLHADSLSSVQVQLFETMTRAVQQWLNALTRE